MTQRHLNPVVHSSAKYSQSILIGLISIIDVPVSISAYRISQYCPDFVSQPYCLRGSSPLFFLWLIELQAAGRQVDIGGLHLLLWSAMEAVVLNPSPQQTQSYSSQNPTAESFLEWSLSKQLLVVVESFVNTGQTLVLN